MTLRTLRAPLALLALLLTAAAPLAQDGIRPGHDVLDTTPIRSGIDSVAVYLIDGDEIFAVGRYLRETTVADGVITREDRFFGRQGEHAWTERFVVEDHSLRPIEVEIGGMRPVSARFSDGAVERTFSRDDDPDTARAELAAPVFHASSLDLVLPSLPLAEGYQTTLLALDDETLAERSLAVAVRRQVNVQQVGGESVTTWEVGVEVDGATDIYHVDPSFGVVVRYESAADGVVLLRW